MIWHEFDPFIINWPSKSSALKRVLFLQSYTIFTTEVFVWGTVCVKKMDSQVDTC